MDAPALHLFTVSERAIDELPVRGVGWVVRWAATLVVLCVSAAILTAFAYQLIAEQALVRAATAGLREAACRARHESNCRSGGSRAAGERLCLEPCDECLSRTKRFPGKGLRRSTNGRSTLDRALGTRRRGAATTGRRTAALAAPGGDYDASRTAIRPIAWRASRPTLSCWRRRARRSRAPIVRSTRGSDRDRRRRAAGSGCG